MSLIKKKVIEFCRIYDYQENGRTFETVDEFLQMLDQEFYKSTRISFRKLLFQKCFHKKFIDELAQMATLVNYDQSVDTIQGFPGKERNQELMIYSLFLERYHNSQQNVLKATLEAVRCRSSKLSSDLVHA